MLEKALDTVKRHNMIEKGDKVIVALSGGADSIALTLALLELAPKLDIEVYAANLNHNIRGDEGERDSAFVKEFCKKKGIPLFERSLDIPRIARDGGIGEEECGRRERYRFFEDTAKALGGAKIATGHHMGDNAETVLFNLFRGTGAKGLCGIPYVRGNIIRPLLDVTKREILSYVQNKGESYVTDSSNLDVHYTRNKIRNLVMPEIKKVFPDAEEKISRLSEIIAADEDLFEKQCESSGAFCDGAIICEKFLPLHTSLKKRIALRALKEWGAADIDKKSVESVMALASNTSGKQTSVHSLRLINSYGKVRPYADNDICLSFSVNVGENAVIRHKGQVIEVKTVDKYEKMSDNKTMAVFDAGKLSCNIDVRTRKDGDYMYPYGMSGRKKIKELFIDMKIPRDERDGIILFALGSEVIFIPNIRRSSRYAADNDTKKFLIIKYTKEEDGADG